MLNATSTQNQNKLYPLAALFTYANNQEITEEKIVDLLKVVGVSASKKYAQFFACDVVQMKSMLCSVSSSSSAPAVSAKVDEKQEEAPKLVEEEVVEETELNFEDLF